MSRDPRAFVALDRGTATVAASLVARVDGHWRLLGATAAPTGVADEAVVERLRRRLAAAEPELAGLLGIADAGAAADLPRIACSTSRPPEMAVVAATQRVLGAARRRRLDRRVARPAGRLSTARRSCPSPPPSPTRGSPRCWRAPRIRRAPTSAGCCPTWARSSWRPPIADPTS